MSWVQVTNFKCKWRFICFHNLNLPEVRVSRFSSDLSSGEPNSIPTIEQMKTSTTHMNFEFYSINCILFTSTKKKCILFSTPNRTIGSLARNNYRNVRFESQEEIYNNRSIAYRMSLSGFQMLMDPSTRPPAMSPRENSSAAAAADPVLLHERRLNRSPLGHSPTTGSSLSSDWKSSLKISRFADELKERSTAPAMVPAAR